MDEARITAEGKEILLDGKHFADAVSPEAAIAIANAMTYAGLSHEAWPIDKIIQFAEVIG